MSPEFCDTLRRLFITVCLVVSPVGISPPPQKSGELPQGGEPLTNLTLDCVDLCNPSQDLTVDSQESTGMLGIRNSSDVASGPAEVHVTTTSIDGIESGRVATIGIGPLEPGQGETIVFTSTSSLLPGATVTAKVKTTHPPDGNPTDDVASGTVHGSPCPELPKKNRIFFPIILAADLQTSISGLAKRYHGWVQKFSEREKIGFT